MRRAAKQRLATLIAQVVLGTATVLACAAGVLLFAAVDAAGRLPVELLPEVIIVDRDLRSAPAPCRPDTIARRIPKWTAEVEATPATPPCHT